MFLRKFFADRRGQIAPIFALAIVPVIGLVGAAVDYSRASSARTAMQAALDATALYLSKEAGTSTPDQLTAKGTAYFNAIFKHPDVKNVAVTSTYAADGSKYNLKVTASGDIDATVARVLGQDKLAIGGFAEVVWGMKRLELALALDNTGSMASSNKMTELKKAAKSLIDTLKTVAKNPDDVKIAILPFATDVNVGSFAADVNVGTSNIDAGWLDWSAWEAPPPNSMPDPDVGPGSNCPYSNYSHGFRCTTGPANGSPITNTIPSSGAYKGYICPSDKNNAYFNGCYNSVPSTTTNQVCSGRDCSCSGHSNCSCTGSGRSTVCTQTITGAPYTHQWIANARSTWNGCVWDREQENDVKDVTPNDLNSTKFQPHQTKTCPVSTMGLSNNWTALQSKIDAMQPVGNTNVTIGLAWGWHALTNNLPMTEGSTAASELDKVIILLTDGDNTQNRWSSSQNEIDARTRKACTNVKAAGIKVYTIRVIDGNASLLRDCATSPDMYFDVQNAGQLSGVFNQIATSLANLRLAK